MTDENSLFSITIMVIIAIIGCISIILYILIHTIKYLFHKVNQKPYICAGHPSELMSLQEVSVDQLGVYGKGVSWIIKYASMTKNDKFALDQINEEELKARNDLGRISMQVIFSDVLQFTRASGMEKVDERKNPSYCNKTVQMELFDLQPTVYRTLDLPACKDKRMVILKVTVRDTDQNDCKKHSSFAGVGTLSMIMNVTETDLAESCLTLIASTQTMSVNENHRSFRLYGSDRIFFLRVKDKQLQIMKDDHINCIVQVWCCYSNVSF
jgi:hypothetical protein